MKDYILTTLSMSIGADILRTKAFGIAMGDSLQMLQDRGFNPKPLPEAQCFSVSPSEQHPNFIEYLVQIDDVRGVFYIKAIGEEINDNGYGIYSRKVFDEIRGILDNKYGTSELVSKIVPIATWHENCEWLEAISQKERIHYCKWDELTSATLPTAYSAITLHLDSDSGIGFLVLEYYGTNYQTLFKKKRYQEGSVF